MSRRDAEKLLVRDGDFLVRESTTNPGQYVLTGMHCGLPKHLLLVDPEGVVSVRKRRLNQLIVDGKPEKIDTIVTLQVACCLFLSKLFVPLKGSHQGHVI